MEDRYKLIYAAAMQQFGKFGLHKTTMQDVADAAQISRQTLYNIVDNKDELTRLVAKYYLTETIENCELDASAATSVEDAVSVFIEHLIKRPYLTVQSMSEAKTFETTTHRVINAEIQDAHHKKVQLIAKTIMHLSDGMSQTQAIEIGTFFCASADGIKALADSNDTLIALCQTLKQATIAISAR